MDAPPSPRRRNVPGWLRGALALGTFAMLLYWERRRPLRPHVEPKLRRNLRNLAVAGTGAAALQVGAALVVQPLLREAERRRWGLLRRLPLPAWIEVPLAVVLLDYSLYVWHVLNHKVPWLWRFHRVHHVDLDLDASTAVRFHFGELAQAIGWNALEIAVLGVSPLAFSTRQTLLSVSILFHHSEVELPLEWERRLVRFVVTPRMHGVHHSVVQEETDSNWSSGLTIWDRLHGTLRLDVPQEGITVGIPAFRDLEEVTLPKVLEMPFGPQRPTWRFPDGSLPEPRPRLGPSGRLLP